jgi:parallel beta-helix repeat protein
VLALVLGPGCSDDATVTPDSGMPDSAADAVVDRGDLGATDFSPGDLHVPPRGCSTACAPGEVCNGGVCEKPGPAKACGTGTYPVGLPASGVLHVNAAHTGTEDGTEQNPYQTIGAALAAAPMGGIPVIAVAEGIYEEQLTISGSVEIHCRCAEKVRIAGTILVEATSGNLEVVVDGCEVAPKNLPAQPDSWGACISSSHKTCSGDGDCTAPETCDPTRLECLHPQEGKDFGIRVTGGPVNNVDLLVRDSVLAGWCAGVYFNTEATSSSAVCLSRTRLWANHKGIEVVNAPPVGFSIASECQGIQEAVAGTLNRIDQNELAGVFTRSKARGIGLTSNLIAQNGRLQTASGTKVADAGGYGIYLGNTSSCHLKDNVVAQNENTGLGMINAETIADTTFDIRDNVFAGNRGAGVSLQQLGATKTVQIVNNSIAGTDHVAGEPGGDGIQVLVAGGTSYSVTVKDNTIHNSRRNGLLLDGVSGSVSNNTVQSSGGYGVLLQAAPQVAVGTNTFGANAKGDVQKAASSVDLCGVLPLPIP